MKFGRLTILSNGPDRTLRCRCDCGNISYPDGYSLRVGKTKSCGCLKLENSKKITHTTTHGMSHTPEHRAWASMFDRCNNPRCEAFVNYGGRGIGIHTRWEEFINFFEDMGLRPAGMSLERVNNDLGYYRGNCVWATRTAQANNRRSTVCYTLGQETLSLAQWHRKLGLSKNTIQRRLKRGWSLESALTIGSTK